MKVFATSMLNRLILEV